MLGDDVSVSGVSIDTRTVAKGNLFFAIKGPRFDGHAFCREASEKGAAAVVVEQDVDASVPMLKVADTRQALKDIAAFWRQKFSLPVVAVTGSNGKTTVKEMIACIFTGRGEALATQGNLNNELGVPLTLFRLNDACNYAVIEIGANHPGEIESIVDLVKPQVSVITMIGPTHLEGFGSLQGVVKAKAEIFSGLDANGIAVINRDDRFYNDMSALTGGRRVCSFGFAQDATVRGDYSKGRFTITVDNQSVSVDLKVLGRHNRQNALAAAAACLACSFSLEEIQQGLEKMLPVPGRLQRRPEVTGYQLIDDTYNASPSSVMAAIDVLAEQPGERCLVLGDMKELGEKVDELHFQIGDYAKKAGVDLLLCTGEHVAHAVDAFGPSQGFLADNMESLVKEFEKKVPRQCNVLVKGSRSSHMENFIEGLLAGRPHAGGHTQ
ncbi:MAG: UDP-N-acetylmuramoyl-tripeptide--D-alanyl-D-alanine ligase [Gammaproteobacteria bacterium]|nr:UDP-N-acetylmuramoyl-tripeptide--D-alanyl-D-alanine ligase [Gammaproteobacteria bacterium]